MFVTQLSLRTIKCSEAFTPKKEKRSVKMQLKKHHQNPYYSRFKNKEKNTNKCKYRVTTH